MGAVAPNPKDRKSFCGTIGAPPMRSFGWKPRFPRRPPSALRGNIKQSENGPSGPRRQSGGDFQAIHLPKIYTITWGPRKNRVFVGKCCEFPPRNPATLHSWGFAPPFGHPGLSNSKTRAAEPCRPMVLLCVVPQNASSLYAPRLSSYQRGYFIGLWAVIHQPPRRME